MFGIKFDNTVFGKPALSSKGVREDKSPVAGPSTGGSFETIRSAYFHEWEFSPSERSQFWDEMPDAVLDRLGQAAAQHLANGETGYFRRPHSLRALDDLYAGAQDVQKDLPGMRRDGRVQRLMTAALDGILAPISMVADLASSPGDNLHIEAESVQRWLKVHRPEIHARHFAPDISPRRADDRDNDGPGF